MSALVTVFEPALLTSLASQGLWVVSMGMLGQCSGNTRAAQGLRLGWERQAAVGGSWGEGCWCPGSLLRVRSLARRMQIHKKSRIR